MERAELDQWKAKEVARLLALVETERRYYQDIVATLPVGLLVVSSELEVISANRAFRRTFKLRSDEVLRRRLQEVLPLPGLPEHTSEVLSSGSMRLHIVYEPPTTPGGRYLRVSIASLRNWEEEAEREALLLVEDLTDVRAALVREQPAAPPPAAPEPAPEAPPAEAAVEAPPDPAPAIRWEADAETLDVLLRNDAPASLLGYERDVWSAPDFWWSAIPPEDAGWVKEFYRKAASQTEVCYCDHRMLDAGGRSVWVRDAIRPLAAAEGGRPVLAGVTMLATAVRRREAELEDAQILEAMSRWSGRLTHDFNNLLMIIMGYGQEILDSLPARDARRGDLEEILRGSQRVAGMVRELMTLSRPPIAEPREIELNRAVGEMEGRLRELTAGRATLAFALDPMAGMVNADPAQLESILSTMVRQAAQLAGPGASIVIETSSVEIGRHYARPGAMPRLTVKLAVRAAGFRLDPEIRAHLFEPLLGIKDPELAPGLFPICGLVRQADGELHVEEAPDGSTVLALYLPWIGEAPAPPQAAPAAQEPSEVIEIPIAEAPAPAPAPPAKTVLIVEDDPGIRALMKKILTRQGFAVMEAAGGEEALMLSEAQPGEIHLLITDLMMPQMGGREVSERLRAQRPGIKVLFVSGYTDDPMIQSGQLPEGTEFLQKPFTLGALLEKVNSILRQ